MSKPAPPTKPAIDQEDFHNRLLEVEKEIAAILDKKDTKESEKIDEIKRLVEKENGIEENLKLQLQRKKQEQLQEFSDQFESTRQFRDKIQALKVKSAKNPRQVKKLDELDKLFEKLDEIPKKMASGKINFIQGMNEVVTSLFGLINFFTNNSDILKTLASSLFGNIGDMFPSSKNLQSMVEAMKGSSWLSQNERTGLKQSKIVDAARELGTVVNAEQSSKMARK